MEVKQGRENDAEANAKAPAPPIGNSEPNTHHAPDPDEDDLDDLDGGFQVLLADNDNG